MKDLIYLISAALWVIGVVFAKGFWSTTIAVVFPFYSWYLVAEHYIL